MSGYRAITMKVAVSPVSEKDPLLSELSTFIEIDDEGGGAFVVIRQHTGEGMIRLDGKEIESVMMAAKKLLEDYEAGK